MDIFSTYHEGGGFLDNQHPQLQYPYISQVQVSAVKDDSSLQMPHERGAFFPQKGAPTGYVSAMKRARTAK